MQRNWQRSSEKCVHHRSHQKRPLLSYCFRRPDTSFMAIISPLKTARYFCYYYRIAIVKYMCLFLLISFIFEFIFAIPTYLVTLAFSSLKNDNQSDWTYYVLITLSHRPISCITYHLWTNLIGWKISTVDVLLFLFVCMSYCKVSCIAPPLVYSPPRI